MDAIDMTVLGGPHHGEKVTSHAPTIALPIFGRTSVEAFDDVLSEGAARLATSRIPPQQVYRRVKFYDSGDHVYHVWVPEEVSDDRVMMHVLMLAAKAPR